MVDGKCLLYWNIFSVFCLCTLHSESYMRTCVLDLRENIWKWLLCLPFTISQSEWSESVLCVLCVFENLCVCVHGVRREGVRLLRNKEPKKTLTKKQKENQTNETVGNSGVEPFPESSIGRELWGFFWNALVCGYDFSVPSWMVT